MHARLNRIEVPPDRLDDAARRWEQETLPQLERLDGFQGYLLMGDRSSGTGIVITYWESAEALQASEEAVAPLRQQAAEAAGAVSAPSVERYEIYGQR